MAPKDDPETAALRKEIESMKEGLKSAQAGVADKAISDICSGLGDVPKLRLQTKRMLKGHIHKVNAIHFAGDSR
jgi:guanine nucleotide-binding protein subunit beta